MAQGPLRSGLRHVSVSEFVGNGHQNAGEASDELEEFVSTGVSRFDEHLEAPGKTEGRIRTEHSREVRDADGERPLNGSREDLKRAGARMTRSSVLYLKYLTNSPVSRK